MVFNIMTRKSYTAYMYRLYKDRDLWVVEYEKENRMITRLFRSKEEALYYAYIKFLNVKYIDR